MLEGSLCLLRGLRNQRGDSGRRAYFSLYLLHGLWVAEATQEVIRAVVLEDSLHLLQWTVGGCVGDQPADQT